MSDQWKDVNAGHINMPGDDIAILIAPVKSSLGHERYIIMMRENPAGFCQAIRSIQSWYHNADLSFNQEAYDLIYYKIIAIAQERDKKDGDCQGI